METARGFLRCSSLFLIYYLFRNVYAANAKKMETNLKCHKYNNVHR
jgi:hypothetical protein